ncbi:hypothetical protein [Parafrankia soli]|uniref:hypothetical protein n=1 Tax=Parafrankia soli TaxID=2599596 RepID=UPI0012FF853C|nr:hypothetical protein [Parafrankia soli]
MAPTRTPTPDPHRQLAEYRARRDRLLAAVGPLTVSQRERLAAVNAQITALGG